MRVLLQRVLGAQVEVNSKVTGRIEKGLLLYVGIGPGDGAAQADWLAAKVSTLRVFEDEDGKLNKSAAEVGGAILAVPNFTLMGDARKGRRPSFTDAAGPDHAQPLFERFVERLRQANLRVETGQFGKHMHILAVADGPVNVVIDNLPAPAQPPDGPSGQACPSEVSLGSGGDLTS